MELRRQREAAAAAQAAAAAAAAAAARAAFEANEAERQRYMNNIRMQQEVSVTFSEKCLRCVIYVSPCLEICATNVYMII